MDEEDVQVDCDSHSEDSESLVDESEKETEDGNTTVEVIGGSSRGGCLGDSCMAFINSCGGESAAADKYSICGGSIIQATHILEEA